MTNELEERNRKRKARRMRRRLFSLLGFALLLIYIPAVWNWVFSVNYEIGVIKTSTLEIKVPLQGVLVRKETPLKSPGDGILIPSISYGERVANKGEVAAFIHSDKKTVVDNYRQTEIEILKRVVDQYDNSFGTERELWENAIETQIGKLTDLSNSGNLSNADSMRVAIDNVLEAKARYLLENVPDGDLKDEKKELERLRSSREKSVKSVLSPSSGVVSYHCDGYEEQLNAANINDITLQRLKSIKKQEVSTDKYLTPSEIAVKKDQSFGKLVTNDEGWIVFFVPEKQGKELKVALDKAKLNNLELSYEVELQGVNERVPVSIQEVGDVAEGYQKVVAHMNKYIEKTMELRSVAGNLVTQSVTGMRVPLRSLINENQVDHTADIVVVEMNKARIKRVQIVGRQDSYAIIDNLDPKDSDKSVKVFEVFLLNPKNVEEGQVVEK
ncbi:MAG: hypothetical protein N2376_10765 [Clostridia bacterium]|nr:hypothetical protein [Clostridia bacterium]